MRNPAARTKPHPVRAMTDIAPVGVDRVSTPCRNAAYAKPGSPHQTSPPYEPRSNVSPYVALVRGVTSHTTDRAIDRLYQRKPFASDADRVALLFKRYQALTSPGTTP